VKPGEGPVGRGTGRRRALDRLLKRAAPRPVANFAPGPHELASGLWALDRQLCYPGGARLPSRTTLIRLRSGDLVVVSPPPLVDAACAAAIDAIGPVRQVVAPNTFHYVYALEFMACHPEARLLAAPGLLERVPEVGPAQEIGSCVETLWSGELEFVVVGPVQGVSEVVFFHTPTSSLILTDLAFNIERFPRPFDWISWRLSGIPRGFGTGRAARWLLLRDRAVASRCLVRISQWPIRRIAHGGVVDVDAKAKFLHEFASYLAEGGAAGESG
jgi:hypothetical protein